MSEMNGAVVIAIPVKDEAERIRDCLLALARQEGDPGHQLLLFLNNCTDGTAAIVRELLPSLSLRVHVVDVRLPPKLAHAGGARAFAMERAVAMAGAEGVVMTTDADGRVYPDWVSANLHYLRNGWDAVAGRAEIDPIEACVIPRSLQDADAVECDYAAALDELAALLDPDAADPWPRHDEHSGASIAATAAAYQDAGGIPPIHLGEDRAFFEALRRTDARLRHAPEVRVSVSARIFGRAQGGMADTIRRRLTKLDDLLDDRLEPVAMAIRRITLRRQCRAAWVHGWRGASDILGLAEYLQIPIGVLRDFLMLPFFGSAWAAIEENSPRLVRSRVPVASVADEMARACAALGMLRERQGIAAQALPANQDDMPAADAAE